MCSICDVQNKQDIGIFTDNDIDKFLEAVYQKVITKNSLDVNYYYKVADILMKGVYKGFGKDSLSVVWGTPDYTMLNSLRENVYIFSGAKNYQKTKIVSSLLYSDKGLKPFSEFKKDAISTVKDFDVKYLTAEYNSAIAQARAASNWMDIEKDKNLYPQLQYGTVGDGRVRPEHVSLDGMVRPVDDKFWDKYYPPNGWNCRCVVTQVNDMQNSDMRKFSQPSDKEVPEIFRFNAGKTKQIFSEAHPYFEAAKEDKDFAKTNFGMPLP